MRRQFCPSQRHVHRGGYGGGELVGQPVYAFVELSVREALVVAKGSGLVSVCPGVSRQMSPRVSVCTP